MTMLVISNGHDNETIFVRGSFLAGTTAGSVPILIDSQTTVMTFPSAIPVNTIGIFCDNQVEACDGLLMLAGY